MLDELTAVVEPSLAEHQQLCNNFPELWRFDQKFMPKAFEATEKTFACSASFFRYIKALKCLASKAGQTLGVFVRNNLYSEDLRVCVSVKDSLLDQID